MRIEHFLGSMILSAALVVPIGLVAAQQAPSAPAKSALDSADRRFVMGASRGGRAEVELGKLASERGSSDAVKQFGQRMVTDHGKAYEELKALADQKGVAVAADMDARDKRLYERLSKLSGAQFDRAYMEAMVKDHKKDVSEFKREARRAKDPELKAWATKTLPTLEEHLKLAQTVDGQVKTSARASK